jgi:hypothetical protein
MLMQGNLQHCTPASAGGELRCMLYIALHRNEIAPSPDSRPTGPTEHIVASGNDVQWRILDVFALLGEFLSSKREALRASGKLPIWSSSRSRSPVVSSCKWRTTSAIKATRAFTLLS